MTQGFGCERQLLLGELNSSAGKVTQQRKGGVCVCVCVRVVCVCVGGGFHYAVKQHRTTEMTHYKQHNSCKARLSEGPCVGESVVCIYFIILFQMMIINIFVYDQQ